MSYDLTVVTQLPPNLDGVRGFLRSERPEATVEGRLDPHQGNVLITVARQPSFAALTLDGPLAIEAEDIDRDLVGVVSAPRWLLELSLSGGASNDDLSLAKALACFLAKEYKGAAYDPQEGLVLWPETTERQAPDLPETVVDTVTLRWHLPYAKRELVAAELLLAIVREHCPHSLPRRFGNFEPLQGKVENGDFGGFLKQWHEAASSPYGATVSFLSSAPCIGGSVSFSDPRDGLPRARGGAKTVKFALDFDGRFLQEQGWREAAADLFVAVARELGAFHAIGYLERGAILERGRRWHGPDSETYPLPRYNRWLGIPPVPAWLTWFGGAYAARLRETWEGQASNDYPEGFLVRLFPEPRDIDALAASYRPFPRELQAKLSEQTLSRQLAITLAHDTPADGPMMDDGPADTILPVG